MKNLQTLLVAISISMIFSCTLGDRFYTSQYIIDNQTDFDVTVDGSSPWLVQSISSQLNPGTELLAVTTESHGNGKKAIKTATDIPFDNLLIEKSSGGLLKKDHWDISNWTGVYNKTEETVIWTLTLTDADF